MKLVDYYKKAEKFNSKHDVYVRFNSDLLRCEEKIDKFMLEREYEHISKDDCFIITIDEAKGDIILDCSYLPNRKK